MHSDYCQDLQVETYYEEELSMDEASAVLKPKGLKFIASSLLLLQMAMVNSVPKESSPRHSFVGDGRGGHSGCDAPSPESSYPSKPAKGSCGVGLQKHLFVSLFYLFYTCDST